jgi:hypothetical protein
VFFVFVFFVFFVLHGAGISSNPAHDG